MLHVCRFINCEDSVASNGNDEVYGRKWRVTR